MFLKALNRIEINELYENPSEKNTLAGIFRGFHVVKNDLAQQNRELCSNNGEP